MRMKTFFLFLLFFSNGLFAQKQTTFEKFAEDSLHKELLGNWYLSAIYTFDINAKHDYVSPPQESFGLKITQDSILFVEPPERFYKRINQHKYQITFEDHYLGQTIELFEPKSKKNIASQFHFELLGEELILTEELNSKGFSYFDISRQYTFNRYFDPLQLETKLQHTWSTEDIINMDFSGSPDTITFYKVKNSVETKKYTLQIQREVGWHISAHIELYENKLNVVQTMNRERGTIILHPQNQELELVTSNGHFFFKVLYIDDSKLVLLKQPNK